MHKRSFLWRSAKALLDKNVKKQDIPIKCNFIAMSIFNVSIQEIVAEICWRSFHPLDRNRAFADVKIEAHEIGEIVRSFPMKLLRHISPELFRRFNRFFVEFLVLLEGRDVSGSRQLLVGLENVLLWHYHSEMYQLFSLSPRSKIKINKIFVLFTFFFFSFDFFFNLNFRNC